MGELTKTASIESVASRIITLRNQRVIMDADLACLYGVETRTLNQAVKRNIERFPEDFMFQLTKEEKAEVITNCDHLAQLRFSSYLPHAFTEHGAIMAANILNSARAVEMSIFVVRAFVRVREVLSAHKQLSDKLSELERKLLSHDQDIAVLMKAIRNLMSPAAQKKRKIGFISEDDKNWGK